MSQGHIPILAQWTARYGDVIRVALGEREAVSHCVQIHVFRSFVYSSSQVFINSHQALAETVVQQGPVFQSRPTFKLFHSDYATSGIWTVGSE